MYLSAFNIQTNNDTFINPQANILTKDRAKDQRIFGKVFLIIQIFQHKNANH